MRARAVTGRLMQGQLHRSISLHYSVPCCDLLSSRLASACVSDMRACASAVAVNQRLVHSSSGSKIGVVEIPTWSISEWAKAHVRDSG